MSVIVTDAGFAPDTFADPIVALADLPAHPHATAVHLLPGDRAAALAGRLDGLHLIRIAFPAFNDGRGFTLARDLRRLGFAGRLRAAGHVLADQYAMIRRAGFDEAEISDALAARQPWPQWQARANWQAHDHRARLFA
ncbi:MAG: DUF934 domain-containing protein [Gemmobacter sp.]|uniref:DUF934 domain-containing protein n=1 Tax=Gemmobacter sp. TaxID=1898957 RepID=UPI003918F4FB